MSPFLLILFQGGRERIRKDRWRARLKQRERCSERKFYFGEIDQQATFCCCIPYYLPYSCFDL